jgi:hypothetical protein
MLLTGVGLSGSGLAAGLAAYKPVMIALSAASLVLSHYLVWRRGWGGRWTRLLLIAASIAAPVLWLLPLHID